MRDLTGRIEPLARRKAAAQQHQRLVSQVDDIEHGAAAQAVGFRQHGQHVHRKEQPAVKAVVARRHVREVDVAALQATGQSGATILDQANLDARMTAPVLGQKIRKQVLDHLRGGADPQQAGLPGFERARPLAE